MIKRIVCCHLCGNRPILEIPLKNGVDFGHTPDLPNEAAQWATIYGIMNPTHRRSHQGILVTLLNNSWLHLLGDPTGPSVKMRLIEGNLHTPCGMHFLIIQLCIGVLASRAQHKYLFVCKSFILIL